MSSSSLPNPLEASILAVLGDLAGLRTLLTSESAGSASSSLAAQGQVDKAINATIESFRRAERASDKSPGVLDTESIAYISGIRQHGFSHPALLLQSRMQKVLEAREISQEKAAAFAFVATALESPAAAVTTTSSK